MKTALIQAVALLFSGNRQLMNIIFLTLKMGCASSLIALLLGAPFGIWLGSTSFRGKQILVILNRTLMGLPPVVCGLICYMCFSGVGPLRHLKLLYTIKGMVIAQVFLITPLISSTLETYVTANSSYILETTRGMRLSAVQTLTLLFHESTYQILYAYLSGLGRAFAEVGAISMVGGAIAFKTNVMTTAIMNYSNRGDFTLALALGILLMLLSLFLNVLAALLYQKLKHAK